MNMACGFGVLRENVLAFGVLRHDWYKEYDLV
jgi:hypothetical protein